MADRYGTDTRGEELVHPAAIADDFECGSRIPAPDLHVAAILQCLFPAILDADLVHTEALQVRAYNRETFPVPAPSPEPFMTARDYDLESFWMPFTANRQFKAAPRILVSATYMPYVAEDWRKILDSTSGLC